MSDTSVDTYHPVGRLAGKWQIPALLLSAALLVSVAVQVKSPQRKAGMAATLERIVRLIDRGLYDTAADLAGDVLDWKETDEATRGVLHLQLARAIFGKAQRVEDAGEETASRILEEYAKAVEFGQTLGQHDYHAMGVCFERQGQFESALKSYGQAASKAPGPALAYRRRIIELSEYPLHAASDEVLALLEGFVADAENEPDELLWALTRQVEVLSAAGRWGEASAVVERFRGRFNESPLKEEIAYMTALSARGAGRHDEAENVLRELLNRVTVSDPVYSKAAWLLGRVVMNDGAAQRPVEAIAIFREVVSARAERVYVAASRVGLAEALAELQQYDEALSSYRDAIDDLGRVGGHRLVNPEVLRSSLVVVAEQARKRGRVQEAMAFLRLALGLIDEDDSEALGKHLTLLADVQAEAGRGLMPAAEARRLLDEAGEHYVRVAWMSTLNEERSAAAMWTAAGLFDEAGSHGRAIELLRAFVRDRPEAEIIPRVLLRLGRSLQAEGRFLEAIEAYRRDVSSYPRSAHANAALIPLAECFMALGKEGEVEAEHALKSIVEDSEIFTPEAAEYRDAMFLLGELYCRQGRFEEAVPVLAEALHNYADDERVPRAMLLIADAYRKSAMAIKDELLKPEFVAESRRLRSEMELRFGEAAERFHELAARLEPVESGLGELDRVFLQDARLSEAACLFELGRYAESLAVYERAAWIYKDSPAALGAYVQVINCYIFLGRNEEAEAALRRAQYLVETIDEALFRADGKFESREGWRRYFDWVGDVLVNR